MTVDEAVNRYADNAEYERTHGNLQGCLDFRQFTEWLKELKQLRESTRWIPVSERMPNDHEYIKNNGLFIVSDGNRSYFGWFGIYNTKKFVKPTIAGFCVDNAVIAWMSLPEPCKAESEDAK